MCIFCDMVAGRSPCHRVWEDHEHLAFLSIFPNSPGVTVVIPKAHIPSYAFDMDDDRLSCLVLAAKKVAKMIDARMPGVGRTGMVFEGFGVDHVHAKLFPLHATASAERWKPIQSNIRTFSEKYEGYISSHDGERMDDRKLAEIAAVIRGDAGPTSIV